MNLVPSSVFFSTTKHDIVVTYVPFGSYVVALAASIGLYYILGNFRAYAEPRRASARRGEAILVLY